MPKSHFAKTVKFEADLQPECVQLFTSSNKGAITKCIQCGTCSATCPLSIYMDYTPRRIIAMLREGFKSEILESFTIWLCASCYSCTVQCPKDIKITDIMYNLKREAIREEAYPKGFTIPVLAQEFFKSVQKNGRMSEGRVIMKMYMKTNPFSHVNKAGLGLRLFRRGRMSMGQSRIKNLKELQTIMRAMDRQNTSLSFKKKEAP